MGKGSSQVKDEENTSKENTVNTKALGAGLSHLVENTLFSMIRMTGQQLEAKTLKDLGTGLRRN